MNKAFYFLDFLKPNNRIFLFSFDEFYIAYILTTPIHFILHPLSLYLNVLTFKTIQLVCSSNVTLIS